LTRVEIGSDLLLSRHPDMQAFADHPDAVLICFVPESAVFLNGLTDDARYEVLS